MESTSMNPCSIFWPVCDRKSMATRGRTLQATESCFGARSRRIAGPFYCSFGGLLQSRLIRAVYDRTILSHCRYGL